MILVTVSDFMASVYTTENSAKCGKVSQNVLQCQMSLNRTRGQTMQSNKILKEGCRDLKLFHIPLVMNYYSSFEPME